MGQLAPKAKSSYMGRLGTPHSTPALTDTIRGPVQPGPGGLAPHLGTLAKSSVSPCKGLKFVLGG